MCPPVRGQRTYYLIIFNRFVISSLTQEIDVSHFYCWLTRFICFCCVFTWISAIGGLSGAPLADALTGSLCFVLI